MTAFIKIALIAGTLIFTGTSAVAQDDEYGTVVSGEKQAAKTILVYYNDLNLSSAKGVERLESRVKGAARSICYSSGIRPLKIISLERQCYDEAVDGAAPQIADAVRNSGSDLAAGKAVISLHRRAG